MHGSGWWSYIFYDEKQGSPAISLALIRRVARYGRPYLARIIAMLGLIVIITLLGLVPPLLIRDLIDRTLPQRNLARLNLLALGRRRWSASCGGAPAWSSPTG